MYLKALEMIGFKSFADKTKLEFEPGLTVIVGPNGCGKSNISDAIRWVLGETSAKALRGSKMEDCIFGGTDTHKPLGMAEVSLTLADCEKALGTEYNEMTVTRRVFRSGEGQYFMNKTPCRLKDIQRLFMDTGIGTSSYSFLEQGRIDRILSSRPEDRREVFEEASGITKYKADKEEAIRKLDHTEANLLRLADVIREVKRQIGSLQRQAGKARSYKVFKEEIRKLDIFATKRRLQILDSNISTIEADLSDRGTKLRAALSDVEEMERGNAVMRESVMQTEREIGSFHEAGLQAKNKLDHARELIEINRQRIEEYRDLSSRDEKEISRTREQLADKQRILKELSAQVETSAVELERAERDMKLSNEKFAQHEHRMATCRERIQGLRGEAFELENTASKLQNQLAEIETRERAAVFQRERLSVEKSQLSRTVSSYEKRKLEVTTVLDAMKQDVTRCEKSSSELEAQRSEKNRQVLVLQDKCQSLRSQGDVKKAQMELLHEEEDSKAGITAGCQAMLDDTNPLGLDRNKVLGHLASHLDVEHGYEGALEAALRNWLDAVLVADASGAMDIIRRLESGKVGPGRVIAADAGHGISPPVSGNGSRLIDHVKCSDQAAPLVRLLIGNVIIVDALDGVPVPVPSGLTYVTKSGSLLRGDGCMEFWKSDMQSSSLLTRRRVLAETERSLSDVQAELTRHQMEFRTLSDDVAGMEKEISTAKTELDKSVRAMAQKEGEAQVVSREAKDANERLETTTWELNNLMSTEKSGDLEKEAIARRIEEIRTQRERAAAETGTLNHDLQQLEQAHSEISGEATSRRIRFSELSQKIEHLKSQHLSLKASIEDLTALADSRSKGMQSYEASIRKLTDEIQAAEGQLASLEEAVNTNEARAESLRKNREKQARELADMECLLTQKRASLDEVRQAKSNLDVQNAEAKLRRQNMIDRTTSDYSLTFDQFMSEPDPAWEGEQPPLETIETRIAELRTKIEAMGPVNPGADEEYRELEERYAFLTTQETDLVNAKQQLMEMIRKINRTTTDMFKSTFDKVNEHFQVMFGKLFNGGSAKLVLVNEEDLLECGIEIIARPPGKRLQNVSLLSGGERTLTAVALLFAIYLIKPSPFCLLDELDAALDEANIGRFVSVLQEFLAQSQFVVITHNRRTIAAADVLYGITMQEKGISSIVSMKFQERTEPPSQPAAVAAPATGTT